MCLKTPKMLLNFERMANSGWQKQIHLDGAFNFCVKDFGGTWFSELQPTKRRLKVGTLCPAVMSARF
jgi:hypothetical protein